MTSMLESEFLEIKDGKSIGQSTVEIAWSLTTSWFMVVGVTCIIVSLTLF
jgi:hypothetical protein